MNTLILTAIENKLRLKLFYDGGYRIVEPHCYGVSTTNKEELRLYQVSGFSKSNQLGWKLFDLKKAKNLELTDMNFLSARPGYKRNDRVMRRIFKQL